MYVTKIIFLEAVELAAGVDLATRPDGDDFRMTFPAEVAAIRDGVHHIADDDPERIDDDAGSGIGVPEVEQLDHLLAVLARRDGQQIVGAVGTALLLHGVDAEVDALAVEEIVDR